MPLDLFASDQQAALADAAHNIAPDLPAGFGEAFDVSLRHASEWSNSLAYSYARERALASYYDDVKEKTGEQLPLYGLGGNVSLDDVNAAQAKIATAHPDLDLQPLTDDSVDAMTMRRMAAAHRDAAALAKRETTWGGTFGGLAGATVGFLSDLPQLALLPLGGAGQLGIAGRALEFAAIGGGSAAVTAGLSFADRERAAPGSAGKEIPAEIATATLFGGALGGAFGALGKWLGASARTLPTAVRDDVNAAASETQFATSNVFDGAAAEMANRDAVTDAVRSAVNGQPVTSGNGFNVVNDDVVRFYHGGLDPTSGGGRWVTPHEDYARYFRTTPDLPNEVSFVDIPKSMFASDARFAGGFDEVNGYFRHFELPEEYAAQLRPVSANDVVAAAEAKLRPVTFGEKVEAEAFDPIPHATDDAASYWETRLADASPEERAALGATDAQPVRAPDLAPEQIAKLAEDTQMPDVQMHDIEHIINTSPDLAYTETVRLADGSSEQVTRPLREVLAELGEREQAAKELQACVIGMEAAE
ncbi:hypothetical protein ACWX0K_11000 [Nitrobacteraceae bacterium UC4446_H13]